MTPTTTDPVVALAADYFEAFPAEAAAELERLPGASQLEIMGVLPLDSAAEAMGYLRADVAASVLAQIDPARGSLLLAGLDPGRGAALLARVEPDARQQLLDGVEPALASELRELMSYPPDSAGALMDPEVTTFRPSMTVAQALARLRALRTKRVQYVFVVDDQHCLTGAVPLQELAVADPNQPLQALMAPAVSVQSMSSQSEVVEILERHRVLALPVVDADGRLVGVIRTEALFRAAESEAMADLQTMVGASKEERALSPTLFAVRKRLPWLNINLLTAFLAASVVGIFEGTIARFTALAVLLPVVAGQSGNTGAQALAVVMRGLALREVRLRQWLRIVVKEASVGAINGVAIAVVTGLGVLVWSKSLALAGVISVAMVISMTIASLAGASVPMLLTLLKQDPAQSSSIVLTTVTDVMGFLSFLGLATLASRWL